MTDPTVSPVALRQRRELTITQLCEHFARDHIEAEDLERLIDGAHQASSLAELDGLLAGLPSLDLPPARSPEESTALARPGYASDYQIVLALMGGAVRQGPWTPAHNVYVTTLMGGTCLDFREANLDAGVTDVYVLAIMGGVEIIVPPGLRVESNGIGIMGGFDHGNPSGRATDRNAPILRISGVAIMGGVEIKEREPGESVRDQRARLRAARREPRPGPRSRSRMDREDDDL
jgi:hypothetical protein